MKKNSIKNVPRYYEPHVNDCFHNACAAAIAFKGQSANLVLVDYLSFMYDENTEFLGVTYLYRHSLSVEFTEEELNTSMEFVYRPGTSEFDPATVADRDFSTKDIVNINMFINDDADTAYERMKELIDKGLPVVAVVDLYYMPYHRAYMKEHGLHAIVITGYDEEDNTLEVFDKYKLSSSDFDGKLPISTVNQGRQSENPLYNPIIGVKSRPIRNLWMEVNVNKDFCINENRIRRIFKESCERMNGNKVILGSACGLERMDAFRNALLEKKENFDEKTKFYFKDYLNKSFKSVSRQRTRFKLLINEAAHMLPEAFVGEMTEYLVQSSMYWDICANVAYKFSITKSPALIDDLFTRIGKIKDIETKITEKLENIG